MEKIRVKEEMTSQNVLERLSHEINEAINIGEPPQKVEIKFDSFNSYIMNNSIDFDEDCYNEIEEKVEEYLNHK